MQLFFDIMFYTFTGLYLYTSVMIIVIILLENRNPVKTLTWIMVLIMIPLLGIAVYLMLGRSFRRQKIISRNSIREISKDNYSFPLSNLEETGLSPDQIKMVRLLHNNSQSHLYADTEFKIYTDGASAFKSLFHELEKAKEHIHIEFFIIENDELGNRFREILIRKALSGVRVRVIYDYLGGRQLKKTYLQSMRDAGIFIQPFLPADSFTGFSRINYRNHRKIAVIDGKVGFTGGINIADRYLKGNGWGLWRDTFVRLRGAGVCGLQNVFLVDWNFVVHKVVPSAKY